MKYRITLSSNPRMIGILAIIALLPGAGIACFFVLPVFLAIIITIVGSYISYHLVKYVLTIIRSEVETKEDSIRFVLGKDNITEIEWEHIDYAGYCTQGRSKPFLYIYQEEEDKLLTVPSEYNGFSDLVDELRKRVAVEDVALGETDTINDYLKEKLEDRSGDNGSLSDQGAE